MRRPRRTFLPAALALTGILLAGPGLAGGVVKQIESQLGVRLATTPPVNARIGSSFEGVVLDPAKLSGKGFPGIKKNDRVMLKIVGPNNAFEVQQAGSPVARRFKFDAQGILAPDNSPAKIAPAAAPALKQ